MSTFNRYYCTLCYNVWDNSNHLPKQLQCSHTFCSKCLTKILSNGQIICPEDMQSQKIRQISELQTNQQLLEPQSQQTEVQQQRLSPKFEHYDSDHSHSSQHTIDKPNRYHKLIEEQTRTQQNTNQYEFSSPQNSNKKSDLIKDQLRNKQLMLKEKFQSYELIQQNNSGEVQRQILQHKKQLTDQIQQKFTELIFKVRNTEGLILQELNIITLKLEDSVRQKCTAYDKEQQHSYLNIQQKINEWLLYPNDRLYNQVDSIGILNQSIQQFLHQIDSEQTNAINDFIKKNMVVKFDLSLYEILPNFCTFNEQKLQQSSVMKLIIPNKSFRNSYTKQPQSYSKTAQHMEPQLTDRIIIRQPTFGKMQFQENQYISNDKRSSSASKLYRSKAYPRIEEQLQNGCPIEKLDLTNQNLIDRDVQEIVQLLKESESKVQIIKLSKNKITDVGFNLLIQCFIYKKELHTLNLSGNLCSDKAINIIDKFQNTLNGKTIYLSNCKINPNKLKFKQLELMSAGINLYL